MNQQQQDAFRADCERIHREWHERAKELNTEGCLPFTPRTPCLKAR
jgi:hypothetical protein